VVILGGVGAGAYYYLNKSDKKATNAGTSSTPGASGGAPSAAGSAAPSSTPTGGGPADALTAQVGDCLINNGTTDKPDLHKTSCVKDTFQVLKRLDGTSNPNGCANVPGYGFNFHYTVPRDHTKDFVLCLKLVS
jgi:hypothetical protein